MINNDLEPYLEFRRLVDRIDSGEFGRQDRRISSHEDQQVLDKAFKDTLNEMFGSHPAHEQCYSAAHRFSASGFYLKAKFKHCVVEKKPIPVHHLENVAEWYFQLIRLQV